MCARVYGCVCMCAYAGGPLSLSVSPSPSISLRLSPSLASFACFGAICAPLLRSQPSLTLAFGGKPSSSRQCSIKAGPASGAVRRSDFNGWGGAVEEVSKG